MIILVYTLKCKKSCTIFAIGVKINFVEIWKYFALKTFGSVFFINERKSQQQSSHYFGINVSLMYNQENIIESSI